MLRDPTLSALLFRVVLIGSTVALTAVLLLVGLVVSVVIHELAHAVVGYALGLRVLRVALGPLELRSRAPHVRIIASRAASVTLVPRSANPGAYAWRVRHMIASAAGPCSNLALGVLAVLLVDLRVRSFPNILWISIGVQSLLIGLLNLRPIRIGRISSDGFTVLQLLRGGAEARRRAVMAALLAMAVDTRPREWDPALIAEIDPDHPTARLALYEWSLDRGDVAEAGRHLDHVVAMRWESFDRADAIVFNEGAYFAARHRADVARARELLARSDSDRVLPWMRARAVAATIHAEGRHDEAREIAQWGLAQLQRARRKDMALEREQLEELAGLRVPTAAVGAS